MNQYLVGIAFTALSAVCGSPSVLRIRGFFPIARVGKRRIHSAKEIGNESFDEWLIAVPGGSTTKVWDAAVVPVQYASRSLLSPFGDW
jgi:hypothetical protein